LNNLFKNWLIITEQNQY